MWICIRLFWETTEPHDSEVFLNLHPRDIAELVSHGNTYVRALSQREYVASIVETYRDNHPTRKVQPRITTGQATEPPIFEDAPRVRVPDAEASTIGELSYAVQGTRLVLSQAYSRIARMLDRWSEWCDHELQHIICYPGVYAEVHERRRPLG